MDTKRSLLRYLLTLALTLFIICGFTITPIAAAEYTADTKIDAKVTSSDGIVRMSSTLRDGFIATAGTAEEPRPVDEPIAECTETYTSDDIIAYTADHPDLEVDVNGHTIGSDGIARGAVDHPNTTIEGTMSAYTQYTRANAPEDAEYAIIEIVCSDSQNMTVELSEWKKTGFLGTVTKQYAIYQWTDNGTVIFKVPASDHHKYNHVYVVDYIDKSGAMDGDGWGARGCTSRDIKMPMVGETLTIDIPSLYDFSGEDRLGDLLKLFGFCALVIIIIFAIALILEWLYPYLVYYGARAVVHIAEWFGCASLAEDAGMVAFYAGLFLGFVVD